MGFLEFVEQRRADKERIQAENRLAEARNELIDVYVRAGREIVEGYNLEMSQKYELSFREMMVAAVDSGYEPEAIEQTVNNVSKRLSKMDWLSPPEGGQVFCALVRDELSRGFSIEVLQ